MCIKTLGDENLIIGIIQLFLYFNSSMILSVAVVIFKALKKLLANSTLNVNSEGFQ